MGGKIEKCSACGGTGYPPDMACPYYPDRFVRSKKLEIRVEIWTGGKLERCYIAYGWGQVHLGKRKSWTRITEIREDEHHLVLKVEREQQSLEDAFEELNRLTEKRRKR